MAIGLGFRVHCLGLGLGLGSGYIHELYSNHVPSPMQMQLPRCRFAAIMHSQL